MINSRLLALIRKEFIQIIRDPRTLLRLDNAHDLFFNLVFAAKNMRVVLCKPAHAQKPMQDTGFFMTVNRSHFKIPDRHFAIRACPRLIN